MNEGDWLLAITIFEFVGFWAFSGFYWWLFRPLFKKQLEIRIEDAKRWWHGEAGESGNTIEIAGPDEYLPPE